MQLELSSLATMRRDGELRGVTSVCSAHPTVLRAALRHGRANDSTVLIEATCNQVNHRGGYTGMRPADFAALVRKIALEEGCPERLVVLGGDHLGPSPWRDLPSDQAMAEAEKMVASYIAAGFRKIHLDASMGCRGEPAALNDEATALRAARLAAVAEAEASRLGGPLPVYVVGTEVPPPGGADHELAAIQPTPAANAEQTIDVHRQIFAERGLGEAFSRAIGLVVQPGVEFGNRNVVYYDPGKATDLRGVLDREPQFVFEAHSTDYQGSSRLAALVRDGFSILKVGPELTFVLREALYALDLIASDLVLGYGQRPLFKAMEELTLAQPEHWSRHYGGTEDEKRVLRQYSLSDRIRYYWTNSAAQAAVKHLVESLRRRSVPMTLFWQHLPGAEQFADTPLEPEDVLLWRVTRSLDAYHRACNASA